MVNKLKTLIIIGAGGHGKVVADCATATQEYAEIKFLDGKYPELSQTANWDVVGHQQNYADFADSNTWYFVAIGNNSTRNTWHKTLLEQGCKIATLIHPAAILAPDVKVGVGSLVLAGVVVNIQTDIGQGCIINTSATVDHDCHVEDFCHIAPGVNLAGGIRLGSEVFIGVGSAVIPCLVIGHNTIVGAGSTVLSDLPAKVTAVGSPARIVKKDD